ncbi:hypothetical protein [Sphingomonas bacterium]|uniref:hypothetical protein n=1 Tax=Sphingomonas bacterium TaxID=1895847 RepID=UPI001576712C|nr:hypothetical protein [Sphingomonas bacterium]
MITEFDDPDIEDCIAASVDRGEFSSVDEARADFLAKLNVSVAQADRGELIPAEEVFERLHQRYANWPRAAE